MRISDWSSDVCSSDLKGAAAMAKVVEDHWPHPLTGLVITPYGHGVDCGLIEVVEAGHPVPDDAGRRGTERVLAMVADLTEDALVIGLFLGGDRKRVVSGKSVSVRVALGGGGIIKIK